MGGEGGYKGEVVDVDAGRKSEKWDVFMLPRLARFIGLAVA
jgi:hypothetical protein